MSLAQVLPPPKHRPTVNVLSKSSGKDAVPDQTTLAVSGGRIPPYGQRQGFVPRTDDDFGDGGAFPEVHRLQYPIGMGKNPAQSTVCSCPLSIDLVFLIHLHKTVATISVAADGSVDYSGIVTDRIRKDQLVYKSFSDLVPKDPSQEELAKPDHEAQAAVTVYLHMDMLIELANDLL